MGQLYAAHGLGNPASVAFAAKVNTAAQRLGVFQEMKDDFIAVGMAISDAETIVSEMGKSTNHAAQMLQALRKSMGDVHGSKPALRLAAYNAIKWASAICGLFEGR